MKTTEADAQPEYIVGVREGAEGGEEEAAVKFFGSMCTKIPF